MTAPGGAWRAAVCDFFTGVPVDSPPPAAVPAADQERFTARATRQLLRHRGRLAACLATVLGPAVVAHAGSLATRTAAAAPVVDEQPDTPSVPVPGDAATWLPAAGWAAATCPGLPSSVLVAMSRIESSFGLQPSNSAAGAVGPLQFLPSTWAAYGVDGDGDGRADVMNPVDALAGTARLLCANGGGDPDRLPSALWNYNHSDEYVGEVLALARFIPAS